MKIWRASANFCSYSRSNPALSSGTGVKAAKSPFGASLAKPRAGFNRSKSVRNLEQRGMYFVLPLCGGRGAVYGPKASGTRQPQAVAHGGDEAECIGVPQHAVPPNPLACECENHGHNPSRETKSPQSPVVRSAYRRAMQVRNPTVDSVITRHGRRD